MRTVLLIAYHFPPRPTVGSLRAQGLAKYLPEFGWNVTVLTAKLPSNPSSEFDVIETPYKDAMGFGKKILRLDSEQNIMAQVAQLKKKLHIKSDKSILDSLLKIVGEVTAYPDPQKGWKSPAVETGNKLLKHKHFDAIISTSSPVTCHIIAKTLKEKYELPWIADLRDLWTQNHYYPYSRLRKRFEEELELRTLYGINALVTVSKPAFSKLAILHKNKPIFIITNGFDPIELNNPSTNLTDKFTITYTGNLYPEKQSAEPLFIALRDLIACGVMDANNIEVRFYGIEVGWLDKQINQYELQKVVKQYGIVSRDIALEKQRESQMLLLLKWNDIEEKGIYSAKLFEYLAAKRPILTIGGYQDVTSDMLDGTSIGYDITSISKLYKEYKTTGYIKYKGNSADINQYSQREMARKYSEILNRVA